MSNRHRENLFYEFDKWGWDVKGWSPRTRKKYLIEARAADRWLTENRQVSLVWAKTKDLQAYLFSKPPTARTRNYIRQALIGFGNFLVDREYSQSNPALGLPSLPTPRLVPKALDVLQAERVLIASEVIGGHAHIMVLLMMFCGLRKTECQMVRWRDVDLETGWLKTVGKGNKERQIPLHPKVKEGLRVWRTRCDDPEWVLPSTRNKGKPVSQTIIQRTIYDVGDMAGLEKLHPHVLRHTFGTHLYQVSNNDIRTVQEALGHASPATTAIYTRIRPARLKEAVDSMTFKEEEDDLPGSEGLRSKDTPGAS